MAVNKNSIRNFDSFNGNQILYNNYIDKLDPIKSINTDYGIFDIKHSKRQLMFDNTNTSMAAVYPGTNGYVVAVDDSFFNLKPKTQDFILGHEIGHMVTGITSEESDFLTQTLETKVDISSGYSYDDIIESLQDIKANISPEYHKAFDARINNIKNYKNKNIKPSDILPSEQIQSPFKWFSSNNLSDEKKKNKSNKKQIPDDVKMRMEELKQQEYERFARESETSFNNKMNQIEKDYNNQSEAIKNMSYSNEDDIVPYEWDTSDLNVSNSLIENADMPKESIDGLFNKFKNPGEKTHRKFTYDGIEYAIKNDLSFGEKGLTGKLVSLSNGEKFNASYILNNLEEAIKTGRYDVISELFDNIKISDATMSSSDLLIESQRLKNEAKKTTQ